MNKLKLLLLTAFLTLSLGADDTEIYQSNVNNNSGEKPKVLIIFDNSSSMVTNNVTQQAVAYNPSIDYNGSFRDDRIYWSTTGTPSGNNYFNAGRNRCAESYGPLAAEGFFQTRAQRWRSSGRFGGSWRNLSRRVTTPVHVDCEADVIAGNVGNGSGQSDGLPSPTGPYGGTGNVNWGGNSYTFYTGNYLNWFFNASTVESTRLAVAQDVIRDLVSANTGIDFGLMIFNNNSDSRWDGGRIVNSIVEGDDGTQRQSILNNIGLINPKTGSPSTFTPLCETTYEAYRYMSGQSVVFANEIRLGEDTIPKDPKAESPLGVYDSPATDCAFTYIILMTDGQPTRDESANQFIRDLTGKDCLTYGNTTSCLPIIAEYMANTDLDNDTTNGNQYAITYTIGFTTDQELLQDTARLGKGQYFTANDTASLTAAFQGAITAILSTNSAFTSPAVAVDTFSRTESRDDIFFAMFEPSDTTNWPGNIKRLRLADSSGDKILVDVNGDPALDPSTGRIRDTAQTYWSPNIDGNQVTEGGVGELLARRDPDTREIYTNTGTGGSLEDFDDVAFDVGAFGVTDINQVYDEFNVTNAIQLTDLILWSAGYDVDDENNNGDRTDARPWILADMLHSKPLAINYGATGGVYDKDNPNIKLVVGTNGGFFHMFSTDTGVEDWAFFPKELSSMLLERRAERVTADNVYGIDASPVVYILDKELDGTIDASDGDRVYVYFGLRRGGSILYALDITDPGSPEFLFKIDRNTTGFSLLGQTWSEPLVTTISGHDGPVLIFGAGYDTNKDATGVGTPDSVGLGVYVVDAITGQLLRSVTPAATTNTNLQAPIQHSVPSNIAGIDSNGGGNTDRLYFGDTGGNLWRVDMLGDLDEQKWRVTKLADVNDGTTAGDRRFFNEPDVVRTKSTLCLDDECTQVANVNYDAVLIGSGDRTNPNATDVANEFYMFRDFQTGAYSTDIADCDDDTIVEYRCDLPITPDDLYDATTDIVGTDEIAEKKLRKSMGWRIGLNAVGEKALSESITLGGTVFFTTFSPDPQLVSVCVPLPGQGRLYAVRVSDASATKDFNNDGNLDRESLLGSLIPDAPSLHFGDDGFIRLLFPSGGGLSDTNPVNSGESLPGLYSIYWWRAE
jgi:type IV pilus assembly protein PilY1